MTTLETVFENNNWERKFSHSVPQNYKRVWSATEAEQAARTLSRLQEETNKVCRSLWLFNDSTGQKLAYQEEIWGVED